MQPGFRTAARYFAAALLTMALASMAMGDANGVPQGQADRQLISAIRAKNSQAALTALRAGANPNARDERVATGRLPDGRKMIAQLQRSTALMTASYMGESKVFRALIAAGASVNARSDDGYTALLEAVDSYTPVKDCASVVRMLLEHGAKPDVKSDTGHTVLTLRYDYPVVRLMVSHGADVNLASKNGVTPLMLAVGCGRVNTVQLLLAHGARTDAREVGGGDAASWAKFVKKQSVRRKIEALLKRRHV